VASAGLFPNIEEPDMGFEGAIIIWGGLLIGGAIALAWYLF